jgi:general stress protein 26
VVINHKEYVMGETKNLFSRDAVAKIRDIADSQVGMLCTFDPASHAMDTRPMATQGIADDATIWFFSAKDSDVDMQILANPEVQLIYAIPGKNEFLALEATASIGRDRALIDQLWTAAAKAWFPNGKDDPNLTIITCTVTGGRYWDTKHGKMVSLAKIALGAITGKPTDDGVKGSLQTRL